jgi:hypothetical protein
MIVLLDNDEIIHLLWKMMATDKSIGLKAFKTPDQLFESLSDIDPETPIYLDSNLDDDVQGEDIGKILYEKGYSNLHLVTGKDPDDFGHLPWIKSIKGKSFPLQ